MWKRTILGLGLMLLCLVGTASAQQNTLRGQAGYVDLDEIDRWFSVEPKVVVNIKGALLELVAEASRFEDPELADLLYKLKAIQVRGFDTRRLNYDDLQQRSRDLARRLENQGWDTVVRVREDDEDVNVFIRVDDGVIAGMMVMAVSPYDDETFFVNIVGEIDPKQIGRIGRKFDIDPLDGVTVDY